MAGKNATSLQKQDGFKSQWGFIMSAVGSCVGMANIWRFPMLVSRYGGLTFLIPYFIFVFIISQSGMQMNSRTVGILPANLIIQKAVAMPPTSIWPSAPMFQNRILNAGARPMAMQVRIMIPSILDEIPDSAMLFLINALAFDGKWQTPYEPEQVTDGTFTAADGSERAVTMMQSSETEYLDDGQATGFIKYYKEGGYAFAALLPNEGVSIDSCIASLTGAGLRETLQNAEQTQVNATLPKFSADYSAELSGSLKALGVTDAFDGDRADFSAMGQSGEGRLFISRVLHKTHIELDEQGTSAAAATAVEMNATACAPAEQPKSVVLNRPFVYMILDTNTMLPVFFGAVYDIPNS